jgi:hypothetical protein
MPTENSSPKHSARPPDVAEGHGERLAAEGEICWGGMHSWRRMVQLLELVGRPNTVGFQADMAHTLLYTLGFNAPEDAILPPNYDWQDKSKARRRTQETHLRPARAGPSTSTSPRTTPPSTAPAPRQDRPPLPRHRPHGKLDIPKHAGYWLRNDSGHVIKRFRHICWDGCMFSNETMLKPRRGTTSSP